jgi:hypothetical protein
MNARHALHALRFYLKCFILIENIKWPVKSGLNSHTTHMLCRRVALLYSRQLQLFSSKLHLCVLGCTRHTTPGTGNTNATHAHFKLHAWPVSAILNLTASIFTIVLLVALLVTVLGDSTVDCQNHNTTSQSSFEFWILFVLQNFCTGNCCSVNRCNSAFASEFSFKGFIILFFLLLEDKISHVPTVVC